jgi:adenylate cyclase
MHREIERKFLVRTERLPAGARADGARLTQGYLAYEPSIRVRLSEGSSEGARGWITIKSKGTLVRDEFEYEVPPDDARALLALAKASLAKVRYRVRVGAHTWDLDEFAGPHQGLWLAEVELGSEDEDFARPDWLGDEVTHDPRYTNVALARTGRVPHGPPPPPSGAT